MALESSGCVVITDAAKAAEQRQYIRADRRVFFTGFPRKAACSRTAESSIPDGEEADKIVLGIATEIS
jgi:hypothetical protein